jgi:hypothetical protein
MILYLFLFLFLIAASIITLSVVYPKQWGGMGIAGFTILFLISMTILTNNFQYKIGYNTTVTYTYNTTLNNTLKSTNEVNLDLNTTWQDSNSHLIGWLLALTSFIGFMATTLNLKGNWRTGE